MIKGTFWLEEKSDGGVTIWIEDYEVEAFDGADYEWCYSLDKANTDKLTDILSLSYPMNTSVLPSVSERKAVFTAMI